MKLLASDFDGRLFFHSEKGDSAYRLKKHNDLGYRVKADTLEELAEKLGVDAEGLKASVEGYNKGVKGEVADDKAQVINNEGNVVDGLYAAGEVVDTSGAYSASVIFGRISGQEAAKHILNK